MKFNEFITKLKMKFLESKDEVLSFNFDGMIISESDAGKVIEHKELQLNDRDLIIDSDFLLSSNIAVAEKYKAVTEFAEKNNIKHQKMTNSGTISNAAIISGMLDREEIYGSVSCKVVAPYLENDFTVLPAISRTFEIGNSINLIFINVSENILTDLDPEKLAFNVIEKINKLNLKQLHLGNSFALLDQKVYESMCKIKRIRFFSILNSIDLMGFESPALEIARHASTGISKNLEVHEIFIDSLDNICLNYDVVMPEKSINSEEIERVFLGGCSNGDYETLSEIAELIQNKTLRKNIEVIVTPSDFAVYKKASESGVLAELSKAGFTIAFPSCASCKGNHSGILAVNEKVLSTFPLAKPGRMGDASAQVFRCSIISIIDKTMH